MTRKYKRGAEVTLARVRSGFFDLQPNALVVTGLRVAFTFDKTLEKEPNSGEVKIYNLSEQSRADLQVKPLNVRVEAGYDGETERVFQGDVRHARSVREGVDWVTTLQIADSDRAYRRARVNRSYKAGVNRLAAVKELAKSLGLDVPSNALQAATLQAQLASGLTLQGSAQSELERILEPTGLSYSIQDGRLQILTRSGTRQAAAELVSADTGMLGSPEFGPPEKKGKPPKLTVRLLLRPSLTPGGLVSLRSRDVSGSFRIEKLRHSADTHGADWMSSIELKPL